MIESLGGPLMLLLDVLFVAVLAGAMIYGLIQWRTRRPSDDAKAERATRQLYREEEAEEERRQGPADMRS